MKMTVLARIAAGALAVSALAGTASAQVTGVLTSQTAHVHSYDTSDPVQHLLDSNGPVANGAVQYALSTSFGAQQNYQVSTEINNALGYIAFANNATAAGANSLATISTNIAVTYTNNTGASVNPTLTSTITPGGFGFYSADITQHPLNLNEAPEAVQPMGYQAGYVNGFQVLLGTVSVDFRILSGVTALADYSAQLDLYVADGGGPVNTVATFSSSMLGLSGFGLIGRTDDPQKQVGYGWGATDVVLSLGDLANGASNTLSYVTTVSAYAFNQGDGGANTLLAYAGFGDPIGSNAGAGAVDDPIFNMMRLGLPTFDPTLQTAHGLGFLGYDDPLSIDEITNDNGDHTVLHSLFRPAFRQPESLDGSFQAPDSVPEPATWALMLGGFGLAGAMLRRRGAPHPWQNAAPTP